MSRAIHEVDRQQQAGHFAGAALVATKDQKVVIEHYAGAAAPGLPAGAAVLWPVASISKLYTAAMIVRLVEQGVLGFNTPVHHGLPEYVGGGREKVRLRHLLTHTAGLVYESPQMAERLIARTPLSALIAEALGAELTFPPGSAFAYGDNNYLVAGHVAEVATGRSFPALVEELVIRPMGLQNTFMPPPSSTFDRVADVRGVMAEGTAGAMYNSDHARGLGHPAFGTVTTAADLTHFAHHHAPDGPRIHSEAAIRAHDD
jgi:CubicO group peptidase (beta-lactamase class C family)